MKFTYRKRRVFFVLISLALLFCSCGKQDVETITFNQPENIDEFVPFSYSEKETMLPRPTKPSAPEKTEDTDEPESRSQETASSEIPPVETAAPETPPVETQPPETPPVETAPPPPPETPQEETAPPPPPPPGGIYPTDDPYALSQQKAVYITFDDGPSSCTPYVLDVLDQYGIKACFFVTFQPQYEDLYRQIINRGHNIGIHTASHNYEYIYSSFDAWYADFQQAYQYVIQVTGYAPILYRFPGGSRNGYLSEELKAQIINFLHSNGIEYYDWNVDTSDSYVVISHEEMLHSTFDKFAERTLPVILMHDGDGQQQTVTVLPEILSRVQSMGYNFRRLDQTVPVIQQNGHWDY